MVFTKMPIQSYLRAPFFNSALDVFVYVSVSQNMLKIIFKYKTIRHNFVMLRSNQEKRIAFLRLNLKIMWANFGESIINLRILCNIGQLGRQKFKTPVFYEIYI